MKQFYLLLTAVSVSTVLNVQAELNTGLNPDLYGSFKSLSDVSASANSARVQASFDRSGTVSQRRIQAYANDGNAEVDKLGMLTLVESEDFSLLTDGEEGNPDLTVDLQIPEWLTDPETGMILFDEYNNPMRNPDFHYPWDNFKKEYLTSELGWGIGNGYPAGGMLYFPFDMYNTQGHISTPWLDLSANGGTFVLEFRIRLAEEPSTTDEVTSMLLVETAETNNMGPTWTMYEEVFVDYEHLSTEWTTFRLLYQGAGPSTLCNIVPQGIEGGMYIDDIKIYGVKPYLATPVVKRHSDFQETSFVANWEPVEGAEKYIFTVWYDDLYGRRHVIVDGEETSDPWFKVENTDQDETYFFTVQAVNSEYKSLVTLPHEVFDIVTPVMRAATPIDESGLRFEGGVEEVLPAFGYNYAVSHRRVASENGPFVVTNETFTGWTHPLYEEGEEYTKEDPVDDRVAALYYPTDIYQQGWQGQNFQIYKDYLCLCPFFYEASLHQDQSAWISPELDLSKDGGLISMSLTLAGQWDVNFENYPSCVVGLYNWNEERGDYDQIELVYLKDLDFDWQTREFNLTQGTSRSKIAIFAIGSYGDLYVDNVIIKQNYQAGETFDDPFFYRTWQLAETSSDPTSFEFEIPEYAFGNEVYQRAQAVRMHVDNRGTYDGEVASPYSDYDYVTSTESKVRLIENDLISRVSVVGGLITINNPEAEVVLICDTEGKILSRANSNEVTYRVPEHGVYVISVGKKSMKIVL